MMLRYRLFQFIICTLSLWLISPSIKALEAKNISEKINEANRALADWQLGKAKIIASELNAQLPDVPPVQALVGSVKFHEGQYEEAVRLLQRASEGGMAPPLLALAQSTYEETKGYVEKRSAHFVMRVPPGKDELLFEKGLWALERAYQKISDAYDFEPDHLIPVDVLDDP